MIRGEPSLAHEGALRRVTPEDGVFQDDAIAFALPVLDNDDDNHHHHPDEEYNNNSFWDADNDDDDDYASSSSRTYELQFTRTDFEFAQRLFAILDTENQGSVSQRAVHEFTTLRCPVFWRRDEDLQKLSPQPSVDNNNNNNNNATATEQEHDNVNTSPTFQEIWNSVISCAVKKNKRNTNSHNTSSSSVSTLGTSRASISSSTTTTRLGVEGWLVFCRFIALAQYLEAKRRFSARHLQQTMRHRNAPRGSEMVVVDVPPPQPPAALTVAALRECEARAGGPLPVPELDLDHSLVAVQDAGCVRRHWPRQSGRDSTAASMAMTTTLPVTTGRGTVHVQLIGVGPLGRFKASSGTTNASAPLYASSHTNALDFAISYVKDPGIASSTTTTTSDDNSIVMVRRSMADLKWLDDSFRSQKVLGGTLFGRILPAFPSTLGKSPGLRDDASSLSLSSTSTMLKQQTVKVAKKSVGKIRNAAKSLWGTTMQAGSYAGQMMIMAGSAAAAAGGSSTATNNGPVSHVIVDDALSVDSGSTSSGGTAAATSVSSSVSKRTSTSSSSSNNKNHSKPPRRKQNTTSSSWDSSNFYNPQAPAAKARQVERYLNYLLEHPALSTSFPLNTILMVSAH